MSLRLPNRALLAAPIIIAATLALAACGEDGAAEEGGASATSDTVSVAEIEGSEVLVAADGHALYGAVQEQGGGIACVQGCTAIWDPVPASAGDSAPAELSGDLDQVARPDGGKQLTFRGMPLYRFLEESPGELTGDGFVDEFEGTELEWAVASIAGAGSQSEQAAPPSEDPAGGIGY